MKKYVPFSLLFAFPIVLAGQVEEGIYSGQNFDPPPTPEPWYEQPLVWLTIVLGVLIVGLIVRRFLRKAG